tara:strand:+ start:50106 stop:51257 length:1152 start_codon:yes stop_codon:yes gene_type:complete
LLTACAKNPVTNQSELNFLSESKEIALGESHYPQAQQLNRGIYRQDPELNIYINQVGQKLAKSSDRPNLPFEFVILNDSVPNAWALPGGKIAINRGLLIHLNSEAELAAVLGHEITHATARHGAKTMERQTVMAAGLGTLAAVLSIKSDNKNVSDLSMLGASATLGMMSLKYGRDAEKEADHYGMMYMVRAGYDPKAAVALQQTFVKLKNGKNSNWLQGLFESHPPSQERANANLEFAKTFNQTDLIMGYDNYQAKIARLKSQQTAYAQYDQANKAFQNNDLHAAQKLVTQSIAALPKEALFYGLQGDILAKQQFYKPAISAYNQAIKLDKQYFEYYLSRGIVYKKLGQYSKAEGDLKQSIQLLPNEIAQNALKQVSVLKSSA